jgi:hypothetical protein
VVVGCGIDHVRGGWLWNRSRAWWLVMESITCVVVGYGIDHVRGGWSWNRSIKLGVDSTIDPNDQAYDFQTHFF